jgi:serine/threonine protein kinase
MRYLEGGTLAQLIRREGRLATHRALAIVGKLADALDYAHTHGVLHRDIKPANVMVEPDDTPILMDFGIARAAEHARITMLQTVMGTAEYLSPEQARGREINARSDLYSLGVLLYECLAGQRPFSGTVVSLVYKHIHEPPPPLHDLCPDLPIELSAVLTRALAKAPTDRFESGYELVASARRALEPAALVHSRSSSATTVIRRSSARTLTPLPIPPTHLGHEAPSGAGHIVGNGAATIAASADAVEDESYTAAWWQPMLAIVALIVILSALAFVFLAR